MLYLHVWGDAKGVSVIEPECLAAIWLLQSSGKQFEIITSNNTNLSPTHTLPLLIDNDNKFSGYTSIYNNIRGNPPSSIDLVEYSLICYIIEKLKPINQYNLYIKSENYEKHTRKLFRNYFPFPMMYNQPLKFYYSAQEIVNTVGLNSDKLGFFNGGAKIAETESVNEDTSEEIAISSLHEKDLIKKSSQKKALKESRYTLKCMNLLGQYVKEILAVYNANNKDGSTVFGQFEGADFIFISYLVSLTSDQIPERFVLDYLRINFSELMKDTVKKQAELDVNTKSISIVEPQGSDIPNLWNEIVYIVTPIRRIFQ